MARLDLNTIKKLEKERNTVHSEVVTTYTVFEDRGTKYFQIDTYGKLDREISGECS